MTWTELCDDPAYGFLNDLPFKVELNRWGKLVLSPRPAWHGRLKVEIGSLLKNLLPGGHPIISCGVETTENTKVADVAWISDARLQLEPDAAAFTQAPEICLEILSRENTWTEILEKQKLYFAAGASEVWLCDEQGNLRFLFPSGESGASALCPAFPKRLDVN